MRGKLYFLAKIIIFWKVQNILRTPQKNLKDFQFFQKIFLPLHRKLLKKSD